jgi:hypothetical protein
VKKIILLMVGILLTASIFAMTYSQTIQVTVLPGEIEVSAPLQDDFYNNRMVRIHLDMSSEVSYFKYSEDGRSPRTLCRRCSSYDDIKPFRDGFHELEIIAYFPSGEVHKLVNFSVDTKAPKIKKTFPRRGFASGEFEVQFQEANVESIFLNYGNEERGWRVKEIVEEECEEERSGVKCKTNVDLSDYDGEEINYWFNVSDKVKNSGESRPVKLDVDSSAPVINFFNFSDEGRKKIKFVLDITEDNFYKVYYIDNSDIRPRWSILCSRLKNGICETEKRFKLGEHNLTIKVLDKAGNFEEIKDILFEI